ncbi:MAG: phage Gp19/Gp15/Gp42 family protein [Lachnospiraceae bacterium]|nr:phage Gp19/Gp15/Gp42 family protein [Lachnospiraceae bacterium]
MGASYATIADIQTYWRTLTAAEQNTASAMISDASAKIRLKASQRGKDFDAMIAADTDLEDVAKTIVCKCVINAMKMLESVPATQFSESAGGYTVSGTYYAPGGGLSISKKDWAELGLAVQTYGSVDVYGLN